MQIDIILGLIILVVGMFLGVGLEMLSKNFWGELGRRIMERIKSEVQVDIISVVHTQEAGLFVHSIELEITKRSKEIVRITNMTIYDKLGRVMPLIMRGQTYPETEFEIYDTSVPWSAFCHRQPTGESDLAKLTLAIEMIGKRTIWRKLKSTIVSAGEFPTGYILFALRM